MAIYHLSAQVISAASGKSAVRAAAYRRATIMVSESAGGAVVDYSGKHNVVHTELALPADTPTWFRTGIDGRSEDGASNFLWNAIEAKEGKKGTGLAMEMNIALPIELSREENIALAQDWVAEHVTAKGFVADWVLHDSPSNPHFHIMIPLRRLSEKGFAGKFDYARDRNGNILYRDDGKPRYELMAAPMKELSNWRRSWAVVANRHLAMAGLDRRIDHRSHREAGIAVEPTSHIGVTASNMAERGKDPERVRQENEKRARNAQALIDNPASILPILTREKSVFDERDIAKALFRYIDDPATFESVRLRVGLSPELVAVAEEVIDPETERVIAPARWTTRSLLRAELLMQVATGELWTDRTHGVVPKALEAALAARDELSDQQREAVRHVVAPERIAAVVGFAGAGKSTMLGVANDAWKRGGHRVHGAALAGKAAEGLERSAGIPSRTLASWELAWSKDRDKLQRGDVFVLDEAGMVSSEQLSRIVQEVAKQGAKLVLVGDAAQLQPIEAGAAFRAITETIGAVELSEIWRQADPAMRGASVAFARGDIAEAIEVYRRTDMVRFAPSREAAREAIITAWKPDYLGSKPDGRRNETLILAHSNQDVFTLNTMAREVLKDEGRLSNEARFVTARGERMFAPGDRIIFLENDRQLGVKNGMLATVEMAEASRLSVRLDQDGLGDGPVISVRSEEYRNLDHGYAATVHKSQGATLDRVHVLATPGMDRHLAYVAMSRHRHSAILHAAHEDFITPNRRNALEGKLGAGPVREDYDEAALSGLVYRLSRDGSKSTTLDHLGQAAFREAAAELVAPFERDPSALPASELATLDSAKIVSSLQALAARIDAVGEPIALPTEADLDTLEHRPHDAANSTSPLSAFRTLERHLDRAETRTRQAVDRARPQDLRALASAFAERRGMNGHTAILPALLTRLRGVVRVLEQRWQRLNGVSSRLSAAWSGIQARTTDAAKRIDPTPPPALQVAPKPLPPFLPAIDLGEHRLEEAALARIAGDPTLADKRAEFVKELTLMVRDPAPAIEAILDHLTEPVASFVQRLDLVLAAPDTYGGLNGNAGLFVSKAAKAERTKAEQAIRYTRSSALHLKATLDDKLQGARKEEMAYRTRLRIEIPGLSPAAQSTLQRIGASSSNDRDGEVAKINVTPELRQEIDAFVKAVSQRFGEHGSIGFKMEQSLPPEHEPVRLELRQLMNGAGILAHRVKHDTLDRDLAQTLEHRKTRDLGLGL